MVGIMIVFYRFAFRGGGGGGIMGVGKSNAKMYVQKATGVTFADVAGQDEAKESLTEIVDFLHHPERYTGIGAKLPKAVADAVHTIILTTKSQRKINALARQFHEFDCDILLHGDKVDLLAYEFQIFREFQFLSLKDYRKGRSDFFKRFSQRFPEARENMKFLIEYLERRRPRVGLYAGTFNPFHIGHFGILQKAELMFDKVILAVGLNPSKNLHHAHSEVVEQVKKLLPFHEVIFFDTLMVDLLDQITPYADVTLVRGLRNGYDLDYEMSQQCFMQEMRPDTVSVYIPCDKQYEHISSSALRSLHIFDCRGRDEIYYPHLYDYYSG
jgi:pantetheine-phosphate adenylyltransferase